MIRNMDEQGEWIAQTPCFGCHNILICLLATLVTEVITFWYACLPWLVIYSTSCSRLMIESHNVWESSSIPHGKTLLFLSSRWQWKPQQHKYEWHSWLTRKEIITSAATQSTNGALKTINSSRLTVDPEGNLFFSNVTRWLELLGNYNMWMMLFLLMLIILRDECPQSCFKVGHISRLSVRLLREFLLQKRIQTWKSRLPAGGEKYPNVLKGIEIVFNEIVRLSNRGQARDCRTNTNQRSNMSRGRTTSGSEGRKSRWLLSRCDNTCQPVICHMVIYDKHGTLWWFVKSRGITIDPQGGKSRLLKTVNAIFTLLTM